MPSKMSSRLVAFLFYAASVSAQSAVWGQCGGIGWTGPTTCVANSHCVYSNDWYSQCLPGAASSVAVSSSTTSVATSVASSTVISTVTSSGGSTSTSAPATSTTGGTTPSICSTIPGNLALTSYTPLPDPFTPISGSRITTKAQWACRQNEINQLIQKYEMGTFPGKPQAVTASLSGTTLTINVSDNGKSISFTVSITTPTSGTKPYPAIIAYGGASIPIPAGVAVITFNNDDIAAQQNPASHGTGKFFTLYGSGASAGAITAWAWGVSRIIDALELTPAANINPLRIGVTGCSRNGKGAMGAGAFEPRVRLTIPQESGSGGAGCWRISDWQMSQGINTQTASEIVGENAWFSPNFNSYATKIPTLPFDHHMLAGLIAPRPIFVIENRITWLGDVPCYGCMKAAQQIWTALGATDAFGFSQQGGHDHCSFPSAQQADLFAYINKYLLDQSATTGVFKADVTFSTWNYAQWIPWSTPTLT